MATPQEVHGLVPRHQGVLRFSPKPTVTAAEPGREFAFNRSGPGIGSYTWRYQLEATATGTRVTESYDVERPVPAVMSWMTEKWVGSSDRDADLHEGMQMTLHRIKQAAERQHAAA